MKKRTIKINKDPMCTGELIFKKASVTFQPGVTVLVGTNGSGKTTLLLELENKLKKDDIPVMKFNNLKEGGSQNLGNFLNNPFMANTEKFALAWSSSEGENIIIALGERAKEMKEFMTTGRIPNRFNVWGNKEDEICSNERWLLIDAVDSGLSIDAIDEVKKYFHFIIDDITKHGLIPYIIISANAYETAYGEDCLDVQELEHLKFSSYEEYKKFILCSKKKKDERMQVEAEREEKAENNKGWG